MSVRIVRNKFECSNCGDKSKELEGVCGECYQSYKTGQLIKIRDSLDKDDWSCGCCSRSYGESWCEKHKNRDSSGPLGPYNAHTDFSRLLPDDE